MQNVRCFIKNNTCLRSGPFIARRDTGRPCAQIATIHKTALITACIGIYDR